MPPASVSLSRPGPHQFPRVPGWWTACPGQGSQLKTCFPGSSKVCKETQKEYSYWFLWPEGQSCARGSKLKISYPKRTQEQAACHRRANANSISERGVLRSANYTPAAVRRLEEDMPTGPWGPMAVTRWWSPTFIWPLGQAASGLHPLYSPMLRSMSSRLSVHLIFFLPLYFFFLSFLLLSFLPFFKFKDLFIGASTM